MLDDDARVLNASVTPLPCEAADVPKAARVVIFRCVVSTTEKPSISWV